MRILEVITLGETGGAQTVLVDLIKGISDRGCDAEIDIVFGSGDFLSQALHPWFQGQIIRMPWLCRSVNPYKDIKAFLKIRRLCNIRNYDLVHCHSSKASWLGRLAAQWTGVPKICMTVHGLSFHSGNSSSVRWIYKSIEKLAFPLATEYIFVSPNDMAEMTSLGLDPSKCIIIPNGRPVPPHPGVGLRELLVIPKELPVVCMVARLTEVKNPLSFLKIAKKVIQQYSPVNSGPKFVLIGDGQMLNECETAVVNEGLEDSVYVLGHKEEASQYFWDADIAVLTSNYEACPLVAIEAMATGTPIVASNVGGNGHVVEHGQTGYLYPSDDESEAARHILHLLQNQPLRESMGRLALDSYHRKFTVERMVDKYVEQFGL